MQSVTRPCPRCAAPMTVPQPQPAEVTCPACRAVFKRSTAAPPVGVAAGLPPVAPQPAVPVTAVPPPTSPSSASGRRTGPVLLLCGAGVLLAAGLVATVILLSRDGTPPEPQAQERAPVRPLVKPPPPPDPRIKIVQPAVDRGVAFLKARLLAKESLPPVDGRIGEQQAAGIAALMGLTLLECGVPATDPAVLRAAEIVRAYAPRMDKIYVLSCALFFLNRWDESRPLEERDRKLARTLALRIISGQRASGPWWYDGVILTPEQETQLLATLKQGTYKPSRPGPYSLSNTQFAMLALWGARKHGVPVRDPLLILAGHFNATQFPDGHWIYGSEPAVLWATSTCAGLIALAIERALREDKEFVARPHVADASKKRADLDKAFAYLAKSIARKKGDPGGAAHGYVGTIFQADAWGDLYFLWSVERVGVIYGKARIGGKDWYDWGYPIALKAQKADGSWADRHGPLVDTCFALLFLKRANIAKDLTDKLRELSGQVSLRRVPARPAPGTPSGRRA